MLCCVFNSFAACFSFSAVSNQYDHFMITNENTYDYILCTALFRSLVCDASISHDFPLLPTRADGRIFFGIIVAK